MRRRLSAVLLAAGLCVSVFSMSVFADETESEAVQQAVEEMAQEETALEEEAEASTEAQTEPLSEEEQIKQQLTSLLTQISSWSDEQIEAYIAGNNAVNAAIASNWKSVKSELGAFVEVTSAEMAVSEDGQKIVFTGKAKYDKLSGNTDVTITYEVDVASQTATMNWEVNYPLGTLMQRAAMNTVMGIGIVFLTLLFLSWLIGKLHYIPEMVEKMGRKESPAVPAPAAPAAAAPAAAEEELSDDLELVAVITAAIAASGTTSGDGFVVRSIKKANKRNWQRA